MIENTEVNKVMEILEGLEDEALAVELLRKFNDETRKLGLLLLNQDEKLDHDEWKNLCDEQKEKVDSLVTEIRSLA